MMKVFFIVLLLYSSYVYPCQYSANGQELSNALEDRESMRIRSGNIANEADSIFIGTVNEVGQNHVVFEDIVQLKGQTSEDAKLEWSTPEVIVVGCGGLSSYNNLDRPKSEDMAAYLVYAKKGKLLRINEVGSFARQPSGYEEIEWLRHSNHIKSN